MNCREYTQILHLVRSHRHALKRASGRKGSWIFFVVQFTPGVKRDPPVVVFAFPFNQ